MQNIYLSILAAYLFFLLYPIDLFGFEISARPSGEVTIEDFDIFEVGMKLDTGQKISYSYDSNGIVLFTLHKHRGAEAINYFVTENKSHNGIFTAPDPGDYYLLWENDGEEALTLSYEISMPESAHTIEYNERAFELRVVSNSNLQNIKFDAENKQLVFDLVPPFLTPGYAEITLPKELLDGELTVGGDVAEHSITERGPSSIIMISTTEGTHPIIIHGTTAIPEYSIPFIVLSALVSCLLGYKFFRNVFVEHS